MQTLRWYLRQSNVSRGCTRNPLTGAEFVDTQLIFAPRQCFTRVRAKSASGAAFSDAAVVLAPGSCFTWVYAKFADMQTLRLYFCEYSVMLVRAKSCGHVQHFQTLRCHLRYDGFSRRFAPNPLTGAAFAYSPLVLAWRQCFTLLYAKSADRCIICGRSVGVCAKTVFHVGVRQICLQVEHLQTARWYLHRDSVSRGCTHVYAKSADRCSICRRSVGTCAETVFHMGCTTNPLTGAAFADTTCANTISHVGARKNLLTGAACLRPPRWYLRAALRIT